MRSTARFALVLLVATLLACRCDEGRVTPKASERPDAAKAPVSAAPPEKENPALAGARYQANVGSIADDCPEAKAVLASAPRNRPDFGAARQVFVANPQFGFVSSFSDKPGQVVLAEADDGADRVALVAQCREGATCKHLAAAYKTVVPASRPELHCGGLPRLGALRPSRVLDPSAALRTQLPKPADTAGQCVRLAACRAAVTGRLDGDPALDCQRKPTAFPLQCAREFPCAAVLACLEGGS